VTTEAYEGNTPQGGASEGNAADDALMVDQGASMIHHQKNETPR
jgi:hypothetical protein